MTIAREAAVYADRAEAGRVLAAALGHLADERPVVLGLPRGGVPVAFEVARALDAPLDVLVARKIGAPGNPELGIGAVAEGGVRVFNQQALSMLLLSHEELEEGVARAAAEVEQRVRRFRLDRPAVPLQGRTVIVVDDGLATGGTARAALRAVRARGARRVVLAVPVGSPEAVASLRREADDIVCVRQPIDLRAIGLWYRDFRQVPDDDVRRLLSGDARADGAAVAGRADSPAAPRTAALTGGELEGDLAMAPDAAGLVIFAHGSGSSRRSPRNQHVARALNARGFATLLFDLLTPDEERERANVFDVPLLGGRLVAVMRWAAEQPELARLPVGFFGASTGAAAALWAAAELRDRIGAVVSRGGRPDLAGRRLAEVRAPVLLIVGGADNVVLDLNRQAMASLHAPARLEVVPGATHLFEEPGALDRVAALAGAWFERHLTRREAPALSARDDAAR